MNASPEGRRPVRRTSVADRSTPQIDVGSLRFRGRGLVRPECVLATAAGDAVHRRLARRRRADAPPTAPRRCSPAGLPPDATAASPTASRCVRDGSLPGRPPGRRRRRRVRAVARRAGGAVPAERRRRRPAADQLRRRGCVGRVWVTVSTRLTPRALGYRSDVADGFVVRRRPRGARIVADGLGYTNELRWSRRTAAGSTSTRPSRAALSRFALAPTATLGRRARP